MQEESGKNGTRQNLEQNAVICSFLIQHVKDSTQNPLLCIF